MSTGKRRKLSGSQYLVMDTGSLIIAKQGAAFWICDPRQQHLSVAVIDQFTCSLN